MRGVEMLTNSKKTYHFIKRRKAREDFNSVIIYGRCKSKLVLKTGRCKSIGLSPRWYIFKAKKSPRKLNYDLPNSRKRTKIHSSFDKSTAISISITRFKLAITSLSLMDIVKLIRSYIWLELLFNRPHHCPLFIGFGC